MKRDACFEDAMTRDTAMWSGLALSATVRPERAAPGAGGFREWATGAVRRAVAAWQHRARTRALLGIDPATLRDLAIAPCEAASVAAELTGAAPATRRRVADRAAVARGAVIPVLVDFGAGTDAARAGALNGALAAIPGIRRVRPSARLHRLALVEYDPAVTGSQAILEFVRRRASAARLIGL